ncbi:unnamed protein product [Rotaria sp. Silwood1]|nr:unnamed protein product [Rotaria sp. Silwood1]
MDLQYTGGDIPWSLSYGEHFNSSNSQATSNELKTIAHRYDFQTLYEQQTTSNNNPKCTNASVFFTNKTIDSDSTEIHQTDFHDDHNHTFCYLCSINEHQHERTKPRNESKIRKLISYKNPKARLSSSSLDQIKQNSSSLSDLISYRFIVRTGKQKNSGTKAQVFLYLYGTEKNWTSIHLQGHNNKNLSTSTDGFPSGSIRTFCFKGPNIGQLHHLNVNLVGSRSDKEWFLKEIEITNLNNTITWLCEFNCWLPKTNQQQINEIKSNVYQQTKLSLSIYILQIRTGEKSITDTNINIHIKIYGTINQTSQLILTNNRISNLFEKNQLDTFVIIGFDLGNLLEIIVELNKNQLEIDWFIKDIIIWKILPNDDQKQIHIYFPFNICLNKKLNKFKSNKELYPLTDHHIKGPICYQVIIKTGNVINVGIDINVCLIIYGKSGRTVIHQLNKRFKNDFEKNTISEFTIMDIDIGKIDRIKIWYDNSNFNSAWFLESIIIYKKYSTCYTISNIYIQRLKQISNILYHQFYEHMNKNSFIHKTFLKNENEHISIDQQNLNHNNINDHLGNNRSILRSPTIYDKINLRKKVTWDEQSIGSVDDLFSIDSQHIKLIQTIDEQKYNKNNLIDYEKNYIDHKIYWISSHNYIDNKWKIKSIEEINSFDFDSSIRSLLLSDRSIINNNNNITSSTNEHHDEIYEFQANCWLAKDKQNGKLEIYLTSKLIEKSSLLSNVNIDSKKKHIIQSDISFKNYDNEDKKQEIKYSSPYDLKSIEKKSSKNSSLHNLQLSSKIQQFSNSHSLQENINLSSHPNTTLKTSNESLRIKSSIDKFPQSSLLTQHLKSSSNMNDLTNPLSSEQELLARITSNEPSHRPRSTISSLASLSQRSKSPFNTNDRTASITNEQSLSMKISNQLSNHSRSSNENIKSSHNKQHLTQPSSNAQNSLSRIPHEQSNYSRSTPISLSSSSQSIKSLHDGNNDFLSSMSNEPELLRQITDELPITSLSPLTSRIKSTRNTTNPLINKRETLLNIPIEPSVNPRLTVSSLRSSNHLSKSSQSNNKSINSLTKTSIESTLGSKSAMHSNPDISSKKSIHSNNIIFIRLTIAFNQCDLSSAINLQWATYRHSLILRVQPIRLSENVYTKNMTIIRKVLVREIIKMSKINYYKNHQIVKIDDIIIIKINDNDNEYLDDICWHLLRLSTMDIILFLNETNTNEFDLDYPPIESTFRIRQHIDTVLNYETYPPKVLIKTRLDKAILSKDYFLQCNSRGNPLPRLLWSKKNDKNDTLEYYPLSKQCKTSCRIYSIQHKYQSILYFRPLILDDIGIYICHAENPMNRTTTSVYLNIDDDHHYQSNINLTCSSLKYCHDRGQCIIINNQIKCVCDNRYFGEQCETSYDDIIKKQDSAILLFQSRFLAGCILFSIGFVLLLIAIISWFLARNNRQQQQKLRKKLLAKKSTEKPLIIPPKETNPSTEINGTIPSSTPIEQINKLPSRTPPPQASTHISRLPILEKKPLIRPFIRQPNMPTALTRESSIATDDDDDDDGDGINSFLRHYQTLPPVPTKIDEEYEERFSLKMNKSEELGLGYLTNGTNNNEHIFSHSYVDYYQPNNQTGLIKPLNIRKDQPQRYTKYVSSYSKFVLPRPVKLSSIEY